MLMQTVTVDNGEYKHANGNGPSNGSKTAMKTISGMCMKPAVAIMTAYNHQRSAMAYAVNSSHHR
jgi:hypothetical protein